jgi:hypothetical protein
MTINIKNLSKVLEYHLKPKVERQLGMTYQETKQRLIDNLDEYISLTNRHWKKKRELEKFITEESITFLDFIKKLEAPDLTPTEYERENKRKK